MIALLLSLQDIFLAISLKAVVVSMLGAKMSSVTFLLVVSLAVILKTI
jgi:hypothetical protein